MRLSLLAIVLAAGLQAAPRFTAASGMEGGVPIIRLTDAARGVEVAIVPSLGNRAYRIAVHGKNLLFFPTDLAAMKASPKPAFNGIPFLAPWGNRIPGGGFWANGNRYTFNPAVGNLSISNGIAIHGLLTASPLWEVRETQADATSAHVTSRLEFWRHPELMANWPFAHEYLMTYRLTDSGLEVATTIRNLGAEPMPIVIGYHPYFQIPDVPRARCQIHIPARKHVDMDKDLVATGALTATHFTDQVSLGDQTFDDGFTDLVRDASGRAHFSLTGAGKELEVVFGPKYRVGLVYAPPQKEFVCFEPMAAITDGINLAHDGKYSELQSVAPQQEWRETFSIHFRGL